MKLITLDNIIRSALITNGLPIHWYFDFLHSAIRCLRELNIDVLKNILSTTITIDNNGNALLPSDYIDWVSISLEYEQRLYPLKNDNSLNPIVNRDQNGNAIPYPINNGVLSPYSDYFFYFNNNFNGYYNPCQYRVNFNTPLSFKVIETAGRIQFDQLYSGYTTVLQYISSGMNTYECNNATLVRFNAIDTIEKYLTMEYFKTDVRKIKMLPLAIQEYQRALQKLTARMNPWTEQDLRFMLKEAFNN